MRPVSQGFRIYAAGRDHGHSSRGLGWPEQDSFPDYLSTLESLTGMWVLMVRESLDSLTIRERR